MAVITPAVVKMVNIFRTNTTLNITIDNITYSFPTSKVILTKDNKSDCVNVKLLGSRKTILTLPNKDINDFN